jgi:hypothetical protein
MCLVIDANRAGVFFGQPGSEAAAPIWAWLKKDGVLVYGGRLAAELGKLAVARKLLLELNRAGRAVLEDNARVEVAESEIRKAGGFESNDPHVLALARVSGARVLYTDDDTLMADFRNPRLLKPKGRIYQRAEHSHLLVHRPGCRKPPKR